MITGSKNIEHLFNLTHFMNLRSFVAWRNPGASKHEGFTASIKVLHSGDLPDKKAFVFSPFLENPSFPSLAFYPETTNFSESVSYKTLFPLLTPPIDKPDDEATYCDRIKRLTSMMQNKELHKAVLSRRIDLNHPAEEMAPTLFNQLCQKYPSAFISLVHIPGVFTWLGATPEDCYRLKSNTL